MRIRPMNDIVVIRRLDGEKKTKGGIIIPDTAQEKAQEGIVLASGPGFEMRSGMRVPTGVKAGDRVLFGKYSGNDRPLPKDVVDWGGQEALFIVASQIEAVIETDAEIDLTKDPDEKAAE